MLNRACVFLLLFVITLLFTNTASAGFIPNPATCDVSNATLNSIQNTDGFIPVSGELLSTSYNATACVGVYPGNDDAGGLSDPSP